MSENPFLDAKFDDVKIDEVHDLNDAWFLKRCRQIFHPKGFIKVGVTHDPEWFEFSTCWNGEHKSICYSKGTLLTVLLSANYENFQTNVCFSLGIDPALLGTVKGWQIQAPLSYYDSLRTKKRAAINNRNKNWRKKNYPMATKGE